MAEIDRLQRYLWQSAQQRYESIALPPFTIFIEPQRDMIYLNYAVPDEPITTVPAGLPETLAQLRAKFKARRRMPRFEFIEEYAPALAPALGEAGFQEEGRYLFMICSPHSYRPAPPVADLTISPLDETTPLAEIQAFMTVQRGGFSPDDTNPATAAEAEDFKPVLGQGKSFLAKLAGQPVSAAAYTAPIDGLVELVGIATLPAFRRRGIASALTDYALGVAFADGVELACLSAADANAGRVYERVGFRPMATMLAYSAID